MSAWQLENFIRTLESWGLTDVLLPFLLIFVIMYAIFTKARILGQDKKNLNMAVSVIIALLVVIPHVLGAYPAGGDIVDIMNRALPTVSIVVVAVIMLLVLLGIFGGDATLMGVKFGNWIAIIALIAIIWIFGAAANWWGGATYSWGWLSSDVLAIIIILLVFGLIIAFVTSEEGDEHRAGYFSKLGDDLKGIFGNK